MRGNPTPADYCRVVEAEGRSQPTYAPGVSNDVCEFHTKCWPQQHWFVNRFVGQHNAPSALKCENAGMSDDAETIGRRIRELRQRLKLTQMDFAVSINVVRSHLTNAELGRGFLGLDKMILMAREYGVSLDWLTGLDIKPVSDARDAEMLRAFRAMTDEAKNGLLAVMRPAAPPKKEPPPPRPFVDEGRRHKTNADGCLNVVPIRRKKPAA